MNNTTFRKHPRRLWVKESSRAYNTRVYLSFWHKNPTNEIKTVLTNFYVYALYSLHTRKYKNLWLFSF